MKILPHIENFYYMFISRYIYLNGQIFLGTMNIHAIVLVLLVISSRFIFFRVRHCANIYKCCLHALAPAVRKSLFFAQTKYKGLIVDRLR